MLYKIIKPDFNGVNKEKVLKIFIKRISNNDNELKKIIGKTMIPKYIYWDEFKHKIFKITDTTIEELWYFIKLFRNIQSKTSPIKSENNKMFTWVDIPGMAEFLHQFDMKLGGNVLTTGQINNEKDKQKLISRGIIEEAIASSQLEGAATTREVAKEFLQEGRKPKNRSEQMILNNYRSINKINDELKNRKLTMDLLLECHSMITEDTWEENNNSGRLRTDNDKIIVSNGATGDIYHIPPKEKFLLSELPKFIAFFNNELAISDFVHPLIKAIMLHFWLGYLHPFCDGNGRMARLIFYWYLLKENYWGMQFLPLSLVIKKSAVAYKMAYIYSEQDDLDLTYFIDYNISKIKIAMREFENYVNGKFKENSKVGRQIKMKFNLNDRQIQLLRYLSKDSEHRTSQTIHRKFYGISKATAIKDLKTLMRSNFLTAERQGKNKYYYATDKVKELF